MVLSGTQQFHPASFLPLLPCPDSTSFITFELLMLEFPSSSPRNLHVFLSPCGLSSCGHYLLAPDRGWERLALFPLLPTRSAPSFHFLTLPLPCGSSFPQALRLSFWPTRRSVLPSVPHQTVFTHSLDSLLDCGFLRRRIRAFPLCAPGV